MHRYQMLHDSIPSQYPLETVVFSHCDVPPIGNEFDDLPLAKPLSLEAEREAECILD